MKYIGVLLMVAAGLGLGMACARRLRVRVYYLDCVERLLEALRDRLQYAVQPLPELWQGIAADVVLSDYPLVREVACELCKGNNFYTSFSRAVQAAARDGQLSAAQAAVLTELGGALGRSSVEQQAQRIVRCVERLEKERQAACQIASERGRVYPMVGLAAGVGLALLLL